MLAALQAERDALLRSATDREAELNALRGRAQQQRGAADQERDHLLRELEALRAQLQQQVRHERSLRDTIVIYAACSGLKLFGSLQETKMIQNDEQFHSCQSKTTQMIWSRDFRTREL